MSTKPALPAAESQPEHDRPLYAVCRAQLVAVEQPIDKPKTSGGRWRLNAGSEMVMRIRGLNVQQGPYGLEARPIRVVIDLATAKFDSPKIRALDDHWGEKSCVLGWWTDAVITAQGIDAALTWFEPKSPEAKAEAGAVALARELVEAGDPMEASIGAYPANGVADYQLIAAGETLKLNGRDYRGEGSLPLYALHNALISEGSLVLWGADCNTGRLAASRLNPSTKDTTVDLKDRIAALTAKHKDADKVILAGIAAGKTDEQIADDVVKAAADSELAALRAENADLKAKANQPPAVAGKPATTGTVPAVAAKAGAQATVAPTGGHVDDANAPTSFVAARALVAKDSGLRGLALNAKVRELYPQLAAGDLTPMTSR